MKVLYFLNKFPEISQTFVVDEILDLIQRGVDVRIVSIKRPSNPYLEREHLVILEPITVYAEDFGGKGGRIDEMVRVAFCAVKRIARRLASGIQSPMEPPGFEGVKAAVRGIVRTWIPDVVQCHFGPLGAMAALLKSRGILPGEVSTVFHGYDLSRESTLSRWNGYEQLFSAGSLFIAISDRWCSMLLEMGAPPSKIIAVKLGVDTSRLEYGDRSVGAGRDFQIVSVGRMTEKKGHEYTIRAMHLLHEESPNFGFHLDIFGGGPLLDEMHRLICDLGLDDQVTLHGSVDRSTVAQFLGRANLFALHSIVASDGDQEGIPVSIMEAMALGIPVVSTKHSGIPELVENGVTGLLVEERDYIAFARGIEAVRSSPAMALEMGRRGRARVELLHCRQLQSDLMYRTLDGILREDALR